LPPPPPGVSMVAEPVPKANTGALKRTARIPELSSLKAQIESGATESAVRPVQVAEYQKVEPGALREAWGDFLELLRQQDRSADFKTLDQPAEFGEDLVINLKLANGFQLVRLEALKVELLAFLREKLRNSQVDLKAEVQIQDTRKRIYTNRDKFEHLSDKYPLLKELRSRLDLDPDY
jgi:DNA polymerase III subunit gamma/tau